MSLLFLRQSEYNTFSIMNMRETTMIDTLSNLLSTISPAPRLQILLAIGTGEACVCHLEAQLGYRQAYISQHMMALRQAGVLTDRRSGRYIYYSLADERILDLLALSAEILDAPLPKTESVSCGCPDCEPVTLQIEENMERIV